MPYVPQWKVRASAAAILGDSAFIWHRKGRYFVGLKFPNGSKMAVGEGANWQEALDDASHNLPAKDPDKLA